MWSHGGRWLARGTTWGAGTTTCRICPQDRAEWWLHLDSRSPTAEVKLSGLNLIDFRGKWVQLASRNFCLGRGSASMAEQCFE